MVAVQVENETGVMGNAREMSDEADALFAAEVPQAFVDYMKENVQDMAPDVAEAVRQGRPGLAVECRTLHPARS